MKTCTKCGKLKSLSEFHNCKANKDGKKGQCKECMYKYGINYKSNNVEKIRRRRKNYRFINSNSIADKKKQWDDENKAHTREYRINNKSAIARNRRKYKTNNPDYTKRNNNKRKRNLGFIPLNKKFDGADGHHIDKQHVIYIPKEIHMSIPHSQNNKESMDKMNELTLNWMLGE